MTTTLLEGKLLETKEFTHSFVRQDLVEHAQILKPPHSSEFHVYAMLSQ